MKKNHVPEPIPGSVPTATPPGEYVSNMYCVRNCDNAAVVPYIVIPLITVNIAMLNYTVLNSPPWPTFTANALIDDVTGNYVTCIVSYNHMSDL